MDSRGPDSKLPQTLPELRKEIFQELYRLAKAKDKQKITALQKTGVSLDTPIGNLSVAGLLASEDCFDSVDFLHKEFAIDLGPVLIGCGMNPTFRPSLLMNYCRKVEDFNHGLMAAAMHNHDELIYKFKVFGARNSYLVMGYAAAKNRLAVGRYAGDGPLIASAAYQYAFHNHTDCLAELLDYARAFDTEHPLQFNSRFQICLDQAARGFAQAGNKIHLMNCDDRGACADAIGNGAAMAGDTIMATAMIKRGAKIENIVKGYFDSYGLYSAETTLQILAFTPDATIRRSLAEGINKFFAIHNVNLEFNPVTLLIQAEAIYKVMQKNNVTYQNARIHLANAVRQSQGLFTIPIHIYEREEVNLQLNHKHGMRN